MKILDCVQGDAAWIKAHVGRPTASQFSRIITQKTLKLSEQSTSYRNELLAEEMLGYPVNDFISQFMERGKDQEDAALSYYEMMRDTEINRVGFCTTDDGRTGCSPDALVGTDGGLEIKTPKAAVHVGYLIDGPDDKYKAQVQGCLWICERQWWDFVSFNSELPSVLIRFQRDEEFIAKLAQAVNQFVAYVDESRAKLIARGYIEPTGDRDSPLMATLKASVARKEGNAPAP
jgi:hypothetical protein